MADPTVDPGIGLYFKVDIQGQNLGSFITCDGLGVDVETEDRIEGGNNDFVWKLPVRMKYSNVKFTRPLGKDSVLVVKWLAKMASAGMQGTTATITCLTPQGRPLVAWNLQGVLPVKWQGPSFSAESPKVAQETLEICHTGFTLEGS